MFAASIPVSLLAVLVIAIPLTIVGIAVDGPVGRLASVAVQAVIYAGLIRLLVVDTGALSWAEMGVRRFDRRALGELASGALWAGPVIFVTIPVAAILSQLFPVTPVSPLPPTGEAVGFAIQPPGRGRHRARSGRSCCSAAFATTAWARSLGDRRALIRGALFFALVHVLTISGASAGEALALAIVGFASRIPVALALGWLFLQAGQRLGADRAARDVQRDPPGARRVRGAQRGRAQLSSRRPRAGGLAVAKRRLSPR